MALEPSPAPAATPSPDSSTETNPNPAPTDSTQNPSPTPDSSLADSGQVTPKPAATEETPAEETTPDTPKAVTFDALEGLPENFNKDDPFAKDFLGIINDPKASPKDRAQNLLGLYQKAVAESEKLQEKAWIDQGAKWQDELIQQYGGEAPLEQKLSRVGGLIDAFDKDMKEKHPAVDGQPVREFGKELRHALTLTGAGNNPANVNFLFWIADQFGEGSPLSGQPPGGGERSRAERIFGG